MPSALGFLKYFIDGIDTARFYMLPFKRLINGVGTGPLDDASIVKFLGNNLLNSDFTKIIATAADPSRSVAEAAINFLFHQMGTNVKLDSLLISDGVTPGDPTGPFKRVNLGLTCTAARHPFIERLHKSNCAPANNVLHLGKSPVMMNIDPGRLMGRCMIQAAHCEAASKDGVSIKEQYFTAYKQAIDNAITESGLRGYFNRPGPYADAVFFGQGNFYTKAEVAANPVLKGALKVVQNITGMTLVNGAGRQVTKGKRAKVTPAIIAKQLTAWGVTFDQEALMSHESKPPVIDTGARPDLAALDAQMIAAQELAALSYAQEVEEGG